ncbi:MAG: hypothetical protein L0Y50_12185, partial [Beijerinckiaceae bacterium]|nr:hypothetical protein [Beijerinckiaceae bacterium]
VGLLPESTARSHLLLCVPVSGLELRRTISLYAVAGRQRPPAASLLIKLLRASDWEEKIGKQQEPRGAARSCE